MAFFDFIRRTPKALVPIALALAIAAPAHAGLVAYTTQASFTAALAGGAPVTTGFDDLVSGTTFGAGTGPAGSGFTLTVTGAQAGSLPTVKSTFLTTSGSNYLGIGPGDEIFTQGTQLVFTFATSMQAFALQAIGGSPSAADDFSFRVGGAQFFNSGTQTGTTDDGGFVYFLGVVASAGDSFSSLAFDLNGSPPDSDLHNEYTLDDIVVQTARPVEPPPVDGPPADGTVPEPGTVTLLLVGLASALVLARQRARRRHS